MEKKNLFVHLPQHNLAPEQLKAVHSLEARLTLPEEVFSKGILKRLRQVRFDEDLEGLVRDFVVELLTFISLEKDIEKVFLHLPIGSPAFMFLLSQRLLSITSKAEIIPIFSHTDRIVEEKDGKKVSFFKFKGFIAFPEGKPQSIIK